MLKKYATTRTFRISQSSAFVRWLVIIHTVAIASVFLNALAVPYKLIIATLILISLFFYLKRFNKVFLIRYSTISGWELAHSENDFYPVKIIPSTVITPYIIVLHYEKSDKQKRTVLVCYDSLMDDEYRKLMVGLKVSGLTE